jgi:phosphoglycerol transferase MdoB-like AlkP superfamily enzyme
MVAALLLPQLPTLLWGLATHSMVYFRGWVNLEYLVLLGIAFLFPSWWTITLLTVEMCIALVEPIAELYYFSPRDTLLSIRYLLLLPAPRLIGYACLLIVYAIGVAVALRATLGGHRRKDAKYMVALALVCCLLTLSTDLLLGRFSRFHIHVEKRLGDVDAHSMLVARSPVVSLTIPLIERWIGVESSSIPPLLLSSALAQAMAEVPAGSKPDVVLVLTESWGLANDDRVNQAQMQPYRNPAIDNLYRVQTGSVQFAGGTTSGETRELCGDSQGLSSLSAPDAYFAGCWPARLKSAGYRTLAVHGYAPGMFRRWEWYQRFGFEDRAFLPDLRQDEAAMCYGAFPGICDADAAQWIAGRLLTHRDGRPDFVHWVTLNSHLPVPLLGNNYPLQQCAAVGIDRQRSLCNWFALVLRVHESVASLALRPGLRPTVFVIVGDHAPPFIREDTRNQFSQTLVPFVVLVPRSRPLQAHGLKLISTAAVSSAN